MAPAWRRPDRAAGSPTLDPGRARHGTIGASPASGLDLARFGAGGRRGGGRMSISQRVDSDAPIADLDPELWAAMEGERRRQHDKIELIASENYTAAAVMEAQGS